MSNGTPGYTSKAEHDLDAEECFSKRPYDWIHVFVEAGRGEKVAGLEQWSFTIGNAGQ
jgi:hypothetical protein